MAERRYDEDEIREIFARATELSPDGEPVSGTSLLRTGSTPSSSPGLTLAELEEVAGEVGIAPARIAEAAAEIELARALTPAGRPHLGVAMTAAHAVALPRMLSEDEWDRFVVRLRDTFGATGTVRTEGSLQTWSNGRLKVLLEPLATGARLRFQSMDGASKQWVDGGVAMGVSAAILAATLGGLMALTGKPIPLGFLGLMGGIGAGGVAMWSYGRSRAARWLPTRRRQFELLGEEVRRIAERGATPRTENPGGSRESADDA